MGRMLFYPFAGAGFGALAAVLIVPAMGGKSPDTTAITLFVGTFLAGTGAIAGAIIGGADYLRRRDQARATRGDASEVGR